jgi:O6-methylguanine-DNA--protein-cysteine methyltransferase
MQTREDALQYGLSFPDADIRRMIAESYDLVTDSPSKRIYEAVKKIPEGRVATYGQVAELTGDKNMARLRSAAISRNVCSCLFLLRQRRWGKIIVQF